jgi:hypothetical protein
MLVLLTATTWAGIVSSYFGHIAAQLDTFSLIALDHFIAGLAHLFLIGDVGLLAFDKGLVAL